MKLPIFVCLATLALSPGIVSASAGASACHAQPKVAGQCKWIRGRLTAYNGTPSFRIWVVGTHRLLGVVESPAAQDADRSAMPASLEKMTDGFDSEVFGDFKVCPLSRPRSGSMQTVCVAAARHITRKRLRAH